MSEIAIRVEGLSKQYRIGGPQARYKTLRESLVSAARAPIRRAGRLLRGEAATDHQETIWALKDVSFEVKHGEALGIIGRNGAGKSTLLKVLSRITAPTEGTVDLYGRVGSLLEVGTGFHPELTGRENVYLNGAIMGMKRAEIDRKFDEIVAFAELEKFLDTPVKHYSSGMYVRLAFAVAAHLEPEVLLVDEVLAVGDVAFQKKCLGKMGEVAGQGRTVLFVSHNMAAIKALCQRAMRLGEGQIRAVGPVDEVVSGYLQGEASGSGVAQLTISPGAAAVIEMVAILDSRNQYTPAVPVHEDFYVRIRVVVREPVEGAQIAFALLGADGSTVFVSSHRDQEPSANAKLVPGVYQSDARIPGGFLNTGSYSLNARVFGRTAGVMRKDLASAYNCLRFSVEDTGSLANRLRDGRRGYVTPVLHWHLSRGEEDSLD